MLATATMLKMELSVILCFQLVYLMKQYFGCLSWFSVVSIHVGLPTPHL